MSQYSVSVYEKLEVVLGVIEEGMPLKLIGYIASASSAVGILHRFYSNEIEGKSQSYHM